MQTGKRERKVNPWVNPTTIYEEWKKTATRETATDDTFTQTDMKILALMKKHQMQKKEKYEVFDFDIHKMIKVNRQEWIEYWQEKNWCFGICTRFLESNKNITPKILHDFLRETEPRLLLDIHAGTQQFGYERQLADLSNQSCFDEEREELTKKLEEWRKICYYMEQFHNNMTYYAW